MIKLNINGKQYLIVTSNKARIHSYSYKVIRSFIFFKIMAHKGCNESKMEVYLRKRAAILKEIEHYKKKVEIMSYRAHPDLIEERDYWRKMSEKLLDTHQQELIALDYKYILDIK